MKTQGDMVLRIAGQSVLVRARKEGNFGFNERSIISACATILSAYRLGPFKPYPAVYLPAGWFRGEEGGT